MRKIKRERRKKAHGGRGREKRYLERDREGV